MFHVKHYFIKNSQTGPLQFGCFSFIKIEFTQ